MELQFEEIRHDQIESGKSENKAIRKLRRSPYPAFVGQALYLAARLRVRQWDQALERVEEVQTKMLLEFVHHARNTLFGRRHGFASIRTYEDYASRVPLGDYDSFAPAFEAMRAGERGILIPEPVKYFGNSSGTSSQGRPKFLPISERQIAYQRGSAADALFRYLVARRVKDFTDGYTLGLFPPTTMRREGPVFITTNPSLQSVRMPLLTKPVQLPFKKIREIANYDEKLDQIVEHYMDYDVRAIAGTTCWFSILFDKLIQAARRRGLRARTVSDIWPNLEVLLGGGVSAGPYIPVIRERMGREFTLVDTYNATEGGIYAVSDHSGERGMLMIPDRGVFFEFVPIDQPSDLESLGSGAKRVPLWGVEKDRLYAIYVTTPSGLYSYRLGDLVRFPSIRPLRIEFAGRFSGCLSTTQELTTHLEIERAVEYALSKHPARTVDYGCAADVGVDGTAKSRYVLFVEFDGPPPNLQGFIEAFDEKLREQNRVYREHREREVAILPPELVVLPKGSVERFLREFGRGNVQTKFPRIIDDHRKAILRAYVAQSKS